MGRIGSRRSVGRTLATAAVAVAISAAFVACSSGAGTKAVSLKTGATGGPAGTPSTAANAATSGGIGGSSPTSAAPAGAPGNGSSPTTAGHQPASPTTATPVSHSATTKATTPATTPASTGPAPTAPATYQYTGSGTTVLETSQGTTSTPAAGQTTLTVTASGSTEQWANSVTTLNLSFTGSGVFLTSETLQAAASTPCVFVTPVAYPPWPLAVGKSSSGTASCSGTPLSIVVQVLSQSGGNYVVKITQTLANTLTVVETDTYSPAQRLPIRTSFHITGSLYGAALSTTSTYTLAS